MKSNWWFVLAVVMVGVAPPTAFAHPGHSAPGGGIVAGLMHPILGLDHLLAMVTVGLLSTQIGGRSVWAIPGSFLASMIVGGLAGIAGWSLPGVEYGIAASIIFLGLAVALDRRFPLVVPLAVVGIFGVFHGHAHGTEMPLIVTPILYALGFTTATALLHATGIVLGRLAVRFSAGDVGLRIAGAAIAGSGLLFVIPT